MKFTLFWADTEGWPEFERFDSEEADKYVDEMRGHKWWNPAPQLIIGDEHKIKEYDGFRYC